MTDHNAETPTYDQLSAAMVEQICNGCGGKGGTIDPPEWRFHDSCLVHDFAYWIGGTESDRRRADKAFYDDMRQACRMRKQWWQRPWYYMMAWVYYRAVRHCGGGYFHYGSRRTWADLRERMTP
jgi:hypothetical protein